MGRLTRRYHVPSALRRSHLRLDPVAARALVDGGALLVDVRRHEDSTVEVPGAVRIPPDEIPDALDRLPRGSPIVLACT
jgi:rhodanese-related sulfurtransferase